MKQMKTFSYLLLIFILNSMIEESAEFREWLAENCFLEKLYKFHSLE